jgi:quercetin dioxygenase-like cupin family protein
MKLTKEENEEKLQVVHHFAGGVYAKEMVIDEVGASMRQHKHHFDHLSILAEGSVWVKVDNNIRQYTAPSAINIEANKNHQIWAITVPVRWYCIHATDCIDPELVDDVIVSEREEQ